MLDFFLELPGWFVAFAVTLAAVLGAAGRWTGRPVLLRAGLGTVLGTAVLLVVSLLGQSDAERVREGIEDLARALAHHDWPAFQARLAPDCVCGPLRHKERVTAGARLASQQSGLNAAWTEEITTERRQDAIHAVVEGLSEHAAQPGRRVRTTWELEWREHGGEWLAETITLTRMDGQPAPAWPDLARRAAATPR